MVSNIKQEYLKEIKYQMKMLSNLKMWLRNMMILSTVFLVLIIYNPIYDFLKYIGILGVIISLIGCFIVGFAIKKGKDNINKLIEYVEKIK